MVSRRREERYGTLQAKLEELRQSSSLLKKKAIIADSSLTELHEVRSLCGSRSTSDIKLMFTLCDVDHVQGESRPRGRFAPNISGDNDCGRRRRDGIFDRGWRGRDRGRDGHRLRLSPWRTSSTIEPVGSTTSISSVAFATVALAHSQDDCKTATMRPGLSHRASAIVDHGTAYGTVVSHMSSQFHALQTSGREKLPLTGEVDEDKSVSQLLQL